MLKVAKGARFVVVVKYTVKVTQDIDLRSRLSELGVVAQSENVFFSLIQNKKYYDGRSRRKEKTVLRQRFLSTLAGTLIYLLSPFWRNKL